MCMQCVVKAEYVFQENAPEILPGLIIMVATESCEDWHKGQITILKVSKYEKRYD